MAKASLNIRLDYDQVLALVRQLCDEDKSRLKDELMAETTRVRPEVELVFSKELLEELHQVTQLRISIGF